MTTTTTSDGLPIIKGYCPECQSMTDVSVSILADEELCLVCGSDVWDIDPDWYAYAVHYFYTRKG